MKQNNRKFSLLQITPDAYAPCDVLYDLSIDRAVRTICGDGKRTDYFLDVLSKPLTVTENIVYRQQVFSDFLAFPDLFDKLNLHLTRYDRIKSDWQEMKLGAPPSSVSNPEALLDHTYASLKVTAMFPSTIVTFFHNIYDLLCKYDISSRALCSIRDYCKQMIENDSLDEIVRISQYFRYHSPEHFVFDYAVRLDHTLRACRAELCDVDEYTEKPRFHFSIGKLFAKKETAPPSAIDVPDEEMAGEDAIRLLNEALRQIDLTLTSVTNNLYEVLYGISRELYFYEIGMQYQRFVSDRGIPLCMPTVLDMNEDRLLLHSVRDLLLITSAKDPASVIPNDMLIDGVDGILIKGLTDTGKTVYLRSCAVAMIFAQSGLPILSDKATLSARSAFFSHFSSAEEDFLKGDVTGRFDQEAKEVSAIVDSLRPYAFVILNETFQTTSYKEGTDAIYNILSVLPLAKTKYIFVTHLTALFDKMKGNNVLLLQTDPSKQYRLQKAE